LTDNQNGLQNYYVALKTINRLKYFVVILISVSTTLFCCFSNAIFNNEDELTVLTALDDFWEQFTPAVTSVTSALEVF